MWHKAVWSYITLFQNQTWILKLYTALLSLHGCFYKLAELNYVISCLALKVPYHQMGPSFSTLQWEGSSLGWVVRMCFRFSLFALLFGFEFVIWVFQGLLFRELEGKLGTGASWLNSLWPRNRVVLFIAIVLVGDLNFVGYWYVCLLWVLFV